VVPLSVSHVNLIQVAKETSHTQTENSKRLKPWKTIE
jgi:hypothetical protein